MMQSREITENLPEGYFIRHDYTETDACFTPIYIIDNGPCDKEQMWVGGRKGYYCTEAAARKAITKHAQALSR